MNTQTHEQLKSHIWEIANRLRGPYRPPQYRLVMLPMVVLRRLDCVLEPTKDAVMREHAKLTAQSTPENAMDRLLGRAADPNRKHPLYNISPFTFRRLLGDAEHIAPNLVSYINGFSPTARSIFERFKFGDQIEKLDSSNRLFTIVKAMADVDLHPDRIDNMQMGYLFEHLVMRFNEQANEEAGDHFTPREVIRLMANLVYTGERDVYRPGIFRTIYDPACGTGGMLSESEKFILAQNEDANLALYGQEYNDESWAICCSDMLIKDEETGSIVLGDTLGDGKTRDGFESSQFHYMLANPPFGVEWKDQKTVVDKEHAALAFAGRFGAGLPAINDGSLLFLQHMISKMHPYKDGDEDAVGSKIAIVFNGSPLFSGDAGSGPSNIRRWIIENDWLDAIVAMPDQLFYNTGIFTYVWLVTNRKAPERRGRVQLIDGTRFFARMKKSLNNKRNEISEEQIRHLTRVYGGFKDGETAEVRIDGEVESRVISRIFENREFGFLKVTVERPLRMNFEASPERIARLDEQTAFANLATSKKRKDEAAAAHEIEEGRKLQNAIRATVATLGSKGRYMDRKALDDDLGRAAKRAGIKIAAPVRKAIYSALGERDPDGEICLDGKGRLEPDRELRDTENISLPEGTALPLPMDFGPDKPNDQLIAAFRDEIEDYMAREVLPHWPDAWVDYDKTKVGYEIPINRHFYVYKPPRPLDRIGADLTKLEGEIAKLPALITGVVTKGLDPAAPIKSSGIDWLGDIPAHWETGNIRRFARMKTGHTPTRTVAAYWDDCTIPWFTLADVWQLRDGTRWYLGETSENISELGLANSAAELLPAGTVVFSRTASVGFSGIMPDPMATSQDFWNWVCGPKLTPEYLLLLFRSMVQKFEESTSGSTHKTIYQGVAAGLHICVPPLEEQRAISSFVFRHTKEIDDVIRKVRESVDRLAEYRAGMITAAVTGKLVMDMLHEREPEQV